VSTEYIQGSNCHEEITARRRRIGGCGLSTCSRGGCADIQRGDTSDGTPMMLFHCHGSPNQNWILTGGTVSGENGVCLDVSGSVPKDGTPIIVVQCNGRPSQKWQVTNGQIVGLGGKCLDLQGGSTFDRTALVITTCNPTSQSQQWSIQ
jgi:hypothetical protein